MSINHGFFSEAQESQGQVLLLPHWFAEDADAAMELVDLNTVIPARCWRESSAIPLVRRTTNNHSAARNEQTGFPTQALGNDEIGANSV